MRWNENMPILNQDSEHIQNLSYDRRRIELWLRQRQDLHNQFCRLLGIKPYDDENNQLDPSLMQEFCSNLTDYISAGHFEIFERLSISTKAQDILAKYKNSLEQVSDLVLSFVKKYNNNTIYTLNNLKTDMNKLGEALFATRMGIEDKLIACYANETSATASKLR